MTRARRGLTAAAASTVWLLALAAPAWAEPSLTLRSPSGDPPTFTSAGTISGTVKGDEERQEKVTSATFSLSETPGGQGCATEIPEDQRSLSRINAPSVDFSLDPPFPCNGEYELSITGTYEAPVVGGLLGGLASEAFEAAATFDVAIPPVPVKGLKATYDAESKKVSLSWSQNPEPDTSKYRIERNSPGPDGWTQIGSPVTGTQFVDTLDVDDEHRYRVIPIRNGPRGSELFGSQSDAPSVTAGPDRPEPTVPDTALVRPPASSSASSRASANRGGGGAAPARRGTAATIDDGFNRNLPFDPSATTTIPASPDSVPPEDAAVLAIDDDSTDEDSRRATMVPIAGGLALMMAAVHLRLLSMRAAEPELPIYATSEPRR